MDFQTVQKITYEELKDIFREDFPVYNFVPDRQEKPYMHLGFDRVEKQGRMGRHRYKLMFNIEFFGDYKGDKKKLSVAQKLIGFKLVHSNVQFIEFRQISNKKFDLDVSINL